MRSRFPLYALIFSLLVLPALADNEDDDWQVAAFLKRTSAENTGAVRKLLTADSAMRAVVIQAMRSEATVQAEIRRSEVLGVAHQLVGLLPRLSSQDQMKVLTDVSAVLAKWSAAVAKDDDEEE